DFRGAGLAIPAQKLAEVPAAGFCEASDELLDSGSLAVVAREIQIHAGAKFFRADQSAHHAHQLRTFFVDRRRIEVIDFLISFWSNRMRQRPRVFDELCRAQTANVCDPFDRSRSHVGREFLITKSVQTLL